MSTNDTSYAPPTGHGPAPGSPPRPPLRRSTGDDKVVAGVAAGVARTLGIDPILVRVAFVVLTIFGGSGILLYLAGWLFIPPSGSTRSSGERFIRDNNALVVAAVVVVGAIVLAPFVLWQLWDGGFGFGGFVLLLLAVAAVVALSRRGSAEGAEGPPAGDLSTVTTQTVTPETSLETAVLSVPPAAQAASPPPRPKDAVLGRLTIGLALLVTGTLVALDLADVVSVSAVTVLSAALAVVAVGLLVGSVVGRSRGLIAAGVGLVLVLIPLSTVPDGIRWNTGAGAGDRTYRVKTTADLDNEYALGAGSLTLDLRQLDLQSPVTVDASVGVGEVIVMLPPDAATEVSIDVGAGVIDLPAQPEQDGTNLDQQWSRPVDQTSGSGAIDLTLSAGIGAVTVIDQTEEVTP
jgi:phage shock protein PspC (stress-responsive transcriptional regulator)